MSNIGKIAVNKLGSQIVLTNGRIATFNQNGACGECSSCKPRIIASYTTSYYSSWDLQQYRGNNIAPPDSYWRLREQSYNLTYYIGVVDENGKLVGLPEQFTSNYSYGGYMNLEIGCSQPDGSIRWS
jgi:hypothetical protein